MDTMPQVMNIFVNKVRQQHLKLVKDQTWTFIRKKLEKVVLLLAML